MYRISQFDKINELQNNQFIKNEKNNFIFCLNLKRVFPKEMSSLPIFKLVSLLAKQLAKPLAIALKAKATTHPNLKNYVVLPTANGK